MQALSTSIAKRFILDGRSVNPAVSCKRFTKSWKKRARKKIAADGERESIVSQYAGDKSNPFRQVFCWGSSVTGALGVKSFLKPPPRSRLKKMEYWHRPYRMTFWEAKDIKVDLVSCGYGFTVFKCKTPQGYAVFGTGVNTDSQLGYQEFPRHSGRILDYVIEPCTIRLPLLDPDTTVVTQIGCGRAHTILVTNNEGVFTLGNNSYGQCGRPINADEDYRASQMIHKVALAGEIIKDVVCGQDHTALLTESGQVYSCGLSGDGQTGLGHYNCQSSFARIRGDIDGENIVQVSGKSDTMYAVSDKGDLFGWGNNEYRQLLSAAGEDDLQLNTATHISLPPEVGRVTMATCGGTISAVLNDKGQVFVWGYGILGKGPLFEESMVPSMLPEPLFGHSELNRNVKVTSIHAGLGHFAAINNKNDLFVWGKNRSGCLGLGDTKDQFFPFKVAIPGIVQKVACGVDHMVALCRTLI